MSNFFDVEDEGFTAVEHHDATPRILRRRRAFWALGVVAVIVLSVIFVATEIHSSSPGGSKSPAQQDAQKGVNAFNAKQYASAASFFSDEINVASSASEKALGYFNRATAYVALSQKKKAISDFESCTSVNPHYQNCWFDLAVMEQDNGNTTLALADYQQVVTLNPKNADALFDEGVLLYRAGSKKSGVSDIQSAIGLNPSLVTKVPSYIKLP